MEKSKTQNNKNILKHKLLDFKIVYYFLPKYIRNGSSKSKLTRRCLSFRTTI